MSDQTLPALVNPTPTAVKRVRNWLKGMRPIGYMEQRPRIDLDPLDVAALQRKYTPARAHYPHRKEATFRVPLNCPMAHYQQIRNRAVQRFVETLAKQGWELVQAKRIQVAPGVYPARDLALNDTPILDEREMIIRAWFRFLNPQPLRIELPPHALEPVRLR